MTNLQQSVVADDGNPTSTEEERRTAEMKLRKDVGAFLVTAALAVAVVLPGRAQDLPAGFTAKDIGNPGAVGSTTVDANGVFTIKGAGADLWGKTDDDFQFAFQNVTGDGSIAARMVSTEGGQKEWVKTGVMIRASDARNSFHATMEETSGHGARFHWRSKTDPGSADVATDVPYAFPVSLMVQRVGNQFTGYTSPDGKLWTQRGTTTIDMPDTTMFGLAVMSHIKGTLMTVKFDNVAIRPGIVTINTSPSQGFQSAATDKQVLVVWNPVQNAVGYNIYRGADPSNMILANATPQVDPVFYEAATGGLGKIIYAVAPVFRTAAGAALEGPAVRVR
jgi:hypothetical protein